MWNFVSSLNRKTGDSRTAEDFALLVSAVISLFMIYHSLVFYCDDSIKASIHVYNLYLGL